MSQLGHDTPCMHALEDKAGSTVQPPSNSGTENDGVVRSAGRGGLAIAFAKIYFLLTGLAQQMLLPHVLGGIAGYGAFASALSLASITYNPITTTSIQSVSRALSHAPQESRPHVLRRLLELHAILAVVSALGFFVAAPRLALVIGAPHIVGTLRILSLVLFVYSIYTPLIGALNGEKRFVHQAAFDILSATLRTVGLLCGAVWLRELFGGIAEGNRVEGAAAGFVIASGLVLAAALLVVGVGKNQPGSFQPKSHLRFLLHLWIGQVLFNLLLQADLTLLRYLASSRAVTAGLSPTAADSLVGAYRSVQLFAFLPFQLLVALTFVIFPMLARADAEADSKKIRQYVENGMRISLIVVGGMLSVIAGLSGPLLRLVFPSPAPELGTRALELLSIGFGFFAIFSVLASVLNSLRRERASLIITLGALVLGALSTFLFNHNQPFGEGLLIRVAAGTSVGLFAAAVAAACYVRRVVGGIVSPVTFLRTASVTAATIAVARHLPEVGKLGTLLFCAIVAFTYFGALVATRELARTDLEVLRKIFARRRHG